MHRVESEVTGPVSVDAKPEDLEGRWTARFVGRIGDRPKMIGRIDFDFSVQGNTLTGVGAHEWMAGGLSYQRGQSRKRTVFVYGYRINSVIEWDTGVWFEGEIHGKQLKMTMHHQIFGSDNGRKLPMDVNRM